MIVSWQTVDPKDVQCGDIIVRYSKVSNKTEAFMIGSYGDIDNLSYCSIFLQTGFVSLHGCKTIHDVLKRLSKDGFIVRHFSKETWEFKMNNTQEEF